MARDDRRRQRSATPGAMISSAKLLTRSRADQPKMSSRQAQAWGYYDVVGELRNACRWGGNALGRARLMGASRPADAGDEPVPVEAGHVVFDVIEALAGGIGRQSAMLRSFGVHLTVPGVGYLIGQPGLDGNDWGVYSADEVVVSGDEWSIKQGEGQQDVEPLPDDHLVVKLWTPHERYHYLPDSPTMGVLSPLREVELMNSHIHAAATSRLAGAGVLLIPSEVTIPIPPEFANEADPLTAIFMHVMQTAIQNRENPSALVPIILRIPGEYVDKVKHLTFATPLDEKAVELREAALRRVATGMDLPAEVLLGLGDANHWTAWQIEESAIKLHIEPQLESICAGLTTGYLWPTLRALRDAGHAGVPDDETDFIVWYDSTELRARPDKSDNAISLYDRLEIGGPALRRELGFDEADKPSPDELERAILLAIAKGAPTLAPIILPALGIDSALPAEPLEEAPAGDVEQGDEGGDRELPDTQDVPPEDVSGPGATAASAGGLDASEAALLAAADAAVFRALERAGQRLRSLTRKRSDVSSDDCPPELVHTCLGVDCSTVLDLDSLLGGAWDRLAEVAARYDTDAEPLARALDAYTRGLLVTGQPHTYERLVSMLGGSVAALPPTSAVSFVEPKE